jgi:uridine kinase
MATKVLALSGPSGSGKSTLAGLLKCVVEAEGWSATLLHGDDYFLGPKMASYWTDENKDHPGAIDLPAVRSKLSRARQQMHLLAPFRALPGPS